MSTKIELNFSFSLPCWMLLMSQFGNFKLFKPFMISKSVFFVIIFLFSGTKIINSSLKSIVILRKYWFYAYFLFTINNPLYQSFAMDCGNFCTYRLLSKFDQEYSSSDFIFSEVFPWASLLPKIWILLLKYCSNTNIVHENEDIFINLKDEELPLLEEYKHRLKEFQKLWWKYSNSQIIISSLKENLKDNYCIIPIKKGEWSHFVILSSIDENEVNLVDNKQWEFSVSIPEFENLIDLENWKYVLFVKK